MPSLRRAALIAGIAQYVVYILAFVQVVIVSRILTPGEIGTYLVASSLVVLAAVPRNLGIMEYIVAVDELTEDVLRSSFTLLLGVGVLMTGAYVLGAGAAAAWFDAPELAEIIPVMAASFLVLAFGIIGQGRMRREMQFGRLAIIRVAGSLTGLAISLSLVLLGYGIAGMAWGFLAANIVTTATVVMMAPDVAVLRPGTKGIGKILNFGSVTAAGTFLMNLGDLGPQLLLGRVSTMSNVGFFGRAQTLITFLREGTEAAMNPVIQPWFARMAREKDSDLQGSFLRVMNIVSALTWPAFTFLYFQVDFLIPFLLGEVWSASVPAAQALAIGGMFSPYASYTAGVLAGLGQVRLRLGFVALAQIARFSLLAAVVGFGLLAFAWGVTAAHVIGFALAAWALHRALGLRPLALLASLKHSLGLAVLVALANLAAGLIFADTPAGWADFATATLFSGIVWIGALAWLRHEFFTQMLSVLSNIRKQRA